ncbi:MAG: phage tail tape measure protein [Pikeienuella sp.]
MNRDEILSNQGAIDSLKASFRGLSGLANGFTSGFSDDLRSSTDELRRANREALAFGRSMDTGLRRAFDRAVFGGQKLSGVLKGLALDMSRSAFKSAIAPLLGAVSGGVNDIVNGGVNSLFSGLFADGAAFSSGRVRAFAKGGVVNGATPFAMRGGMGLMGEAGPEAIMPLSRGADGKLGVKAEASTGAVSVTVNISTPDVESFRRSQTQVSSALARAVQRGQRNQ